MKKILIPIVSLIILSCSKKQTTSAVADQTDPSPRFTYDTTAVDSFGPGATSESVMAKINAVAIKKEQDSLAKIAKAEQEKLDQEKTEKDKEKAKAEKKETKPEIKTEATPVATP